MIGTLFSCDSSKRLAVLLDDLAVARVPNRVEVLRLAAGLANFFGPVDRVAARRADSRVVVDSRDVVEPDVARRSGTSIVVLAAVGTGLAPEFRS